MSELNDLEGAFNIIVEEVYNSKFYGHFQYYPQSPVDALCESCFVTSKIRPFHSNVTF